MHAYTERKNMDVHPDSSGRQNFFLAVFALISIEEGKYAHRQLHSNLLP
jgi:hypothetical protein